MILKGIGGDIKCTVFYTRSNIILNKRLVGKLFADCGDYCRMQSTRWYGSEFEYVVTLCFF